MPPPEDHHRRRRAGAPGDPTNLHLKKELSQLRKAARGALKDPGTSSSASAKSLTNNGNDSPPSQIPLQINNNGAPFASSDNESDPDAKQAFLCNWRDRKKPGVLEVVDGGGDDGEDVKDEVSSSFNNVDSSTSVSVVGGNGYRSDGCLSSVYGGSAIIKCNGANVTPSIRRTIRKKAKRMSYSSAGSRPNKDRMQMLLSRYAKSSGNVMDGSSFGDETDEYCNSPLLTRIEGNRDWAQSPTKSSSSYKKEDDPVSYNNRYSSRTSTRNPSIVESWDATTISLNDVDHDVEDDGGDAVDGLLDFSGQQKGCGIPCYWSRRSTPKSRSGSCCSPSLSETLMMRKGNSMFGGSQTGLSSKVPLLRNGADDRYSSLESDDEHFTNFGELDLEALSSLDGKRFSPSCRNEVNDEGSPEHIRSLSLKYRPMFFEELIGQNIVVKALKNAVLKSRVSPLYLFHGPRGVGKVSTARIFASALNCLSIEETKPCGVCRECADSMSGKSRHILEVNGSNKKGIERVEHIFKKISAVYFEKYKVFVVNECHLLPSRAWITFHRILEKPLPRVVFILVSSDIDSVPRAVLSRCHKHFFNKISNGDIVSRLRKVSSEEGLDVELGALDLVASNADGSIRDAEILLDQLSMLGKRITKSLVNELIGVVSDDKLMELLELAMSSNATETVIRARELMDSGVDPTVLMSQLVTLIVDVIAGTCPSVDAKGNDSFVGGRNLTQRELDRLKHALTVLSEAEKHLRFSCERSTWFTASLLQLGSVPSPDRKTRSISSQRKSFNSTEEDSTSIMPREEAKQRTDTQVSLEKAAHGNSTSREKPVSMTNDVDFDSARKDSEMMIDIWMECIEKCPSQTLRQLLLSYGKLVLLSEMKGGFVAHIAFEDSNIKTRAEGFLSSITNSFEIVFRCNVEVKLLQIQDSSKLSEPLESMDTNGTSFPEDCRLKVPLRRLESIIHEERLESAWLQAMDRNTPVSMSPLRPKTNKVLLKDGMDHPNKLEPVDYVNDQLHHRTDELNHKIKELKINGVGNHTDKIVRRNDRCPISPSLLHNGSIASHAGNDSMGYESGPGAAVCGPMLCWNNRRGKSKRRNAAHESKSGRFSWFGECAKGSRHTDNSLIL